MTHRDLARAYVAAIGTDGEAAAREALSAAIVQHWDGVTWWVMPNGDSTDIQRNALQAWRRHARGSGVRRGATPGPRAARVWVEVLVTAKDAERVRVAGEGLVRVWGVKTNGGEA